ncbi:hypothetical protein TTHERM_00689940 (macronuclear) [Tetrahymena thermophila SB210]|uniref:Uncharacterized protein n=1 Tax=Tetrahymena thermophila (strain SB210) TaxID=312017 RepID=I7M4G1_TETTS|nr:hypothetical protein TTHERM_00689940 [Tetrahymena thermophila SB210]EAS06755.2 hypothetical protein TTHERM_00689940 [Tetrahymena thermophila SB210]|eukprot:XP_001026997.2 hypothetical protein TTHERM_00689940 [Tetrahymena thermophila SB210]
MKKSQKQTQNEGSHMSVLKQNEISLANGPLKEVLVEHSNKIKSFSTTKRSEIEWLRLGQSQAISVDFIDRKLFDRKEDKLLLFKNINIPSIKIKDTSFQCQKAHFLSVRRLESEDKYRQIELKSKSLSFVFDQHGDCQIQHVRFKETSFHHHGDSFQLVIAMTNFDNQLVSTFISSPFIVESRKKPFQERAHKEQNISTLYDPFLPSILEKQYNLGGSQIEAGDKSKIIGEDLQSLIIYFSAQNIRHKIIHPLYLLFKFPKAISLFYNKNIIKQENISPENLIIQIQRYIYEKLLNASQSDSIEDESEQRLLILCLKSNNYSININKDLAKVSKYMSFLEGPTLTFLEKTPTDLPKEFKLIENIDEMKAAYSKVYCEISQIKIEIKMNQDKLENQFHQVIEKRGGIPSLEQTLNINYNNNEQQDCNQTPRSSFKKNSFHYICYNLSIQDSNIKQRLQKFPIVFETAKDQNEKNNQMEIEKTQEEQQTAQCKKSKNQTQQFLSKQQSKNSNYEKERDNNSIQLNSIRKEIDQISQLSYHIADDEYNNSNSTMNNQQNKKVAKFRVKNQNENQVKVICIQSYSKSKFEDNHSSKIDQNPSNLKKRKISLLIKDNQTTQNQNNQNQILEYNIVDVEPQKKRKQQSSQTDEGDQKNSQSKKKQSSIQVESDQKQINIKMNNLHLNQQNSQQQQKLQNTNYRELDKKDFQGNTSSTASTFNKTIKKIGLDSNKNGQNNSSSSSVSSKNKDARQINFQYNHNKKKIIIATQSSSSDSQNVNGSYSVMLSHSKQQNNSINDQECSLQNDRSLHNSHQNKMEVEFLYERLSQDSNERKKKNMQFKEANNMDSVYNGYESDFSQQNEDNDSEVDKDAAQNKQIGKKFKLEQYLKGYENDDEFDYNVEDDDEDFSFDQSQKIKKQDFFRRRRFSLSNSAFQSQSSLIKNQFKGSINTNNKNNSNSKCLQLIQSYEGQNNKDNKCKYKIKQNLLKTQIKSYISCNEEKSNPVDSC